VVLAILIELLVLIFSHLGKKSDLMLAFIVACFSVVSFSYITFATDSHRMNRVESAKEKKEILIESKMRAKKELAEVKKELHKLNSLFVWQSEKNFKTLALKKTQPLIDKKNQKKEVILAEIAAIDKKLLNSLDKNEETWTMTVGSWLFIVLKIILQISAMILLFRASKMKPTKKKAVV
jgi:16S rRNA C1402 (ribose-2'-O) methylase RsmI